MSKPKTQHNIRAGKVLQFLRIEKGILEQDILAKKLGWLENKVRDREIAVASITLVDILRFSKSFNMNPVDIAHRMISPICINLDRTVTSNPEKLELWLKSDKLGNKNKWAKALIEKDFPGVWKNYDDYHDAVLFLKDTIDDKRRDIEDEIKNGKRQPFELIDASNLNDDWALEQMRIQGRNLKAIRLQRGLASQWVAASRVSLNASWCQVREGAKVVIKLEDLILLGEGWKISPYKLVDLIFRPVPPSDDDLKTIRAKYC